MVLENTPGCDTSARKYQISGCMNQHGISAYNICLTPSISYLITQSGSTRGMKALSSAMHCTLIGLFAQQ